MTDPTQKPNDKNAASKTGGDTEEDLQNELDRESKEGGDDSDDVASNRNVTGSSTWTTLPDQPGDKDSKKSS